MKKMIIGIIIGIALCMMAMFAAMPKMMLKEKLSPLSHAETVEYIKTAVTNGGWNISHEMNLQKSLAKHGKEVGKVTVLKLCQPEYSSTILKEDGAMLVSVMMPCSISVYEKSDGKTYVSSMNAGLMGRMFGGTIAKVMAGSVAQETAEFIRFP